ncbi:hypothetical protein [Magnetofaba australis]|uniref:Uncharacterized protein n=1 Tax=Magnetofaba australis IT-1 TaxID=1434232 RepID=A0A1Y2JZ63_9PROT|nr:hypothetical protein [Magnetofaba australis]OSM00176.1 hypothetical protein MAIT1_00626 [Magnetofaba australis IT-1]
MGIKYFFADIIIKAIFYLSCVVAFIIWEKWKNGNKRFKAIVLCVFMAPSSLFYINMYSYRNQGSFIGKLYINTFIRYVMGGWVCRGGVTYSEYKLDPADYLIISFNVRYELNIAVESLASDHEYVLSADTYKDWKQNIENDVSRLLVQNGGFIKGIELVTPPQGNRQRQKVS